MADEKDDSRYDAGFEAGLSQGWDECAEQMQDDLIRGIAAMSVKTARDEDMPFEQRQIACSVMDALADAIRDGSLFEDIVDDESTAFGPN